MAEDGAQLHAEAPAVRVDPFGGMTAWTCATCRCSNTSGSAGATPGHGGSFVELADDEPEASASADRAQEHYLEAVESPDAQRPSEHGSIEDHQARRYGRNVAEGAH